MGGAPLEFRVKVHKEIDSQKCALKTNPCILAYSYIVPGSVTGRNFLEERISEHTLIMGKGNNTFPGMFSLQAAHRREDN